PLNHSKSCSRKRLTTSGELIYFAVGTAASVCRRRVTCNGSRPIACRGSILKVIGLCCRLRSPRAPRTSGSLCTPCSAKHLRTCREQDRKCFLSGPGKTAARCRERPSLRVSATWPGVRELDCLCTV